MKRREFIKFAAMAGGCASLGGCRSCCGSGIDRVPYGDTIGDRLWMWGHHAMSFASMKGSKEDYHLPYDRRIDMADACRDMGIPGCFVVRWRNLPVHADVPEYMRQFRDMRRVGFSITDSAPESFADKVRLGFEMAERMPNLTTLIMDDYWSCGGKLKRPFSELVELHERMAARRLKLGVVLYSDANGVKPEYREVLDLCDEVTFWFWHGRNTGGIEGQVGRLREMIGGDKPVLLGQYMWDFGGKKPMPAAAMENQLAQTSRLLAAKAIHGVIFHCTPLVDMGLDAVNVSREWIKANADRRWGSAVAS